MYFPLMLLDAADYFKEDPMPKITDEQLDNWFTHHPPLEQATIDAYETIRRAGRAFAAIIIANTPPSADQSSAIRRIREVCFTANAAIACGGK